MIRRRRSISPTLRRAFAPLGLAALLGACSHRPPIKVVRRQGLMMDTINFPVWNLNFPSGLRVLIEQDRRTNLAGVFLIVGAGSTSDPVGKEGLAHYIEHLTLRSHPQKGASIATRLLEAGAISSNAETHWSDTRFYEVGLASDLPKLLRVEGLRMLTPVVNVSPAEQATELAVVENELRLRNETGFVGQALADMQAALFPPTHPYSRPTSGTLASLRSITAADQQAFIQSHYRPDNMTMLVIGNVEPEGLDRLINESLPKQLLEAASGSSLTKVAGGRLGVAPPIPDSPPAPATLPKHVALVSAPELWIGWTFPRSLDAHEANLHFLAAIAEREFGRVDDKDVAGVDVSAIAGLDASILLCRVVLYEGRHPEKTLQRVLERIPKSWESAAAAWHWGMHPDAQRVATVRAVLRTQNLITRGLSRVSGTHFSGDPALYARTIEGLMVARHLDVLNYAAPHLTAARARAILFTPPSGVVTSTRMTVEPLAGPVTPQGGNLASGSASTGDLSAVQARIGELLEPGESGRIVLGNGMRVVMHRRPGLPLITARVAFPYSLASSREYPAALLAFNVANPAERQTYSPDEYGAEPDGGFQSDVVVWGFEGGSGNSEAILARLAEDVRNSEVNRSYWLHVQDEAADRWEKRKARSPEEANAQKLMSSVLKGSPVGEAFGVDLFRDVSAREGRRWFEETIRPSNATLIVAGDFEFATMVKLIHESFDGWKEEEPHPLPPVAAPISPARSPQDLNLVITSKPGATQTQLLFGCLQPAIATGTDLARRRMGAVLLGDHLGHVLREQLGATYGISADLLSLRGGTNYLQVEGAIELAKLAPALHALRTELGAAAKTPPSAAELANAKVRAAAHPALSRMTNDAVTEAELTRVRLGLTPLADKPLAAEFAAVQPEDVRAELAACLAGNPTLAMVGDEKAIRAAVHEGWR